MAALPITRLTFSPLLTTKRHQPLPLPQLQPPHLQKLHLRRTISCSYSPTPATDRLISSATYFFPLINGLRYGGFLFSQYPILAVPFKPLFPLLSLYHSIPSASFVSFFALYLGIVRNSYFSRYVRFNALQALVLDVLLAVPVLLQSIISPGRSGIGLKFTIWMYNVLFVFVAGCFLYGLVSSILGKTPYLPFVADAARRQLD